jgi:hypothetical protein
MGVSIGAVVACAWHRSGDTVVVSRALPAGKATARGRTFLLALLGLLGACGASPATPDVPEGGDAGSERRDALADVAYGADASRSDAAVPDTSSLPRIEDLCQFDDGDLTPAMPEADESLACVSGLPVDSPTPFFPAELGALPADYAALHALCGRMDPSPSTYDHALDPALSAALDDYLRSLLDRPALRRALSDLPEDPAARLARVRAVWLTNNALEHVLCGELNEPGDDGARTVGGLHLWSEFYLAEREGRLDYHCEVGPADPQVAAVTFRWRPARGAEWGHKPLGSFRIGMSPACYLALGVQLTRERIEPVPGNAPALRARLYGRWTQWSVGVRSAAIITLFPLAGTM